MDMRSAEVDVNVAVTGAGGFIGSHLVTLLRKDGHYVVGIDKKPESEWTKADIPVNLAICTDVNHVANWYGSYDTIYHLAAEARIQPSFREPMLHVRTNVHGTAAVLEVARECGARVIYAGSSTADDDVAKNVYATTKRQGEMLCSAWSRAFGLSTAVARFYNVYGPRQVRTGKYATVIGIWEDQLERDQPLTVTGSGTQRRDFTHVYDIVSGLAAIAEKGRTDGYKYSIGSGKNHSIIELAGRLVEQDYNKIMMIPRPPGESESTLADLTDMRLLGWEPQYDVNDYIDSII